MEKMTPECAAVVKLLGDLINEEVAKPDGQADMDFVMECDALLSGILDEKFPLTDEEIAARLIKLKIKTEKPKNRPNLGRISRRIAVCAASFMLALLGVYGAYSGVPEVKDWVDCRLSQNENEPSKKPDLLEITSITCGTDETESPRITIEFSNPAIVCTVGLNGGRIESGEEILSSMAEEESADIEKKLGSCFNACWRMLWDSRDTLSID